MGRLRYYVLLHGVFLCNLWFFSLEIGKLKKTAQDTSGHYLRMTLPDKIISLIRSGTFTSK